MASSAIIKVGEMLVPGGTSFSTVIPIPNDAIEIFLLVPAGVTDGTILISSVVTASPGTAVSSANQRITGDAGLLVGPQMYVVRFSGAVMQLLCNTAADAIISVWKRSLVG